jgi:hypothetical protein
MVFVVVVLMGRNLHVEEGDGIKTDVSQINFYYETCSELALRTQLENML